MTSDSASRVTRSSRSLRLALVLFGCCLAVATVLRAQEPVPKEESPATTEGTEADDVKEAEAPAAEEQGRKPGVVGPTPGRFEPTEKVRADFDVSFPVDI
ncbi:MAG: hypothetical protein WBO04_10420 [Steroidobacteraceae bacterium]